MESATKPKTARVAIHSLLFLIVFVAGGFAGYALCMQGRPEERPGGRYRENPGKFESEAAARISRKYELSPEASQKLHEAIQRNGEKLRKLNEEFQPRFQDCFRELNEEIRSLIPEERRAEFDEEVARMRSRMPFERRPGGMDNSRRSGREGQEGDGRPRRPQGERGQDARDARTPAPAAPATPKAPAVTDEDVSPLRGEGATRTNGFTGSLRHTARDGRGRREVRGTRGEREQTQVHPQEQGKIGIRPQSGKTGREQMRGRDHRDDRCAVAAKISGRHAKSGQYTRGQFNQQRGGERGQMMRRGGEREEQSGQMHGERGMRPQMRGQFNQQRGGERGQMMRRGGEREDPRGEGKIEQPARERGERTQARPSREAIQQMRALVPEEKQAEFDRILREMLAPTGDTANPATTEMKDVEDVKKAGDAEEAPIMRYRVRPLNEDSRGRASERPRR